MRILVTSATVQETLLSYNKIQSSSTWAKKGLQIKFACTGIGMLATAINTAKLIANDSPNLIIQAGIAGAFNTVDKLSKVVLVEHEIIGDLGVEENGEWKDLFDMKFQQPNTFPYKKKKLTNPYIHNLNKLQLPIVTAVTVNEITTNSNRIELLQKKYNPAIETMEGAALHYIALDAKIPFLQIRSLSNYMGERDKTKWQLQKSIEQLNKILLKLLPKLAE